jgi:chaperonin GroEL
LSIPPQKKQYTNRVIFQPTTQQAFQRGMNAFVGALIPTLGPLPGIVAIGKQSANRAPELLDIGGIIARRIIQIEDPDANMGAMFVRQMLCNLHEKVGDGTATAAVIFQAIYNRALRYISSGGNPMLLRKHLEIGVQLILDQVDSQAVRLDNTRQLAQIARSTCYHPEMAELLQEIMDIVGPYGLVEIRTGQSREMGCDYVEGTYWDSNILSQQMLAGWSESKAELSEAAILITDLVIEEPQEILPALKVAVQAGYRKLMLVARKLSDKVVGLLITASKDPEKLQVIAAKIPGASIDKVIASMEDLAILTGGRSFSNEAGENLNAVKADDFGHAHKTWVTKTHFGILRGQGNSIQLRTHVNQLINAYHATDDAKRANTILERIGRLNGGSAALYVGGATKSEMESRKEIAERSIKALRGAMKDGIIPGAGIALLNCQPVLEEKISGSTSEDEKVAYKILHYAMEAPLRTMLINAHRDPGSILASIRNAGPGYGYDILRGDIVSMHDEGVKDVASVQKAAIHSAVSSAALALTVDVFIHRKQPPIGTLTP